MMSRGTLFTILMLLLALQGNTQAPKQQLPEKTRILFLLDASGSMLGKWENTYRIIAAKRLLSSFVDSLQSNGNLELALRVYGHQYDRRYNRCDDSKLEVGFKPGNHSEIITKLNAVQPKGTTPIAYSLEQAANDFPIGKDYRNIIIIITDGIESCDGDPCSVSLALQKKGIFLKPFIIGIGMEKNYQDAFGCIGSFYDAKNINEFRKALSKAIYTSVQKTSLSVELLDDLGNPTEKDVNITFINSFTQLPMFNFVHYRDLNGKPDSVEVESVLTYDIVVNTVPPVVKKGVNFEAGKHNVLPIECPQEYLEIVQEGHFEYKDGVKAIVKDQQNNTLTSFKIPGKTKLLQGYYKLEILTLPRINLEKVAVMKRSPRTIELEKPGIVNFASASGGIGSIYRITNEGKQFWVTDLPDVSSNKTVTLQPGAYKVVFRSQRALGSKYTNVKEFNVTPGSTLNVRL